VGTLQVKQKFNTMKDNSKLLTEAEQTNPVIEMTIEQICEALGKNVKVVSSEWQTIKSQYQDFKKDEGKNE